VYAPVSLKFKGNGHLYRARSGLQVRLGGVLLGKSMFLSGAFRRIQITRHTLIGNSELSYLVEKDLPLQEHRTRNFVKFMDHLLNCLG